MTGRGPGKVAFIGISLIVIADQLTKYWIIANWPEGGNREIIPGFFSLVFLKNTGAAWGLFQGQTLLLSIFSFFVLALMLIKFSPLTEQIPSRILGLTLIAGGISGNLIDRLFRDGVVDFLLFYYQRLQWPAFNLADSAITVGVVLFVYSTIFAPHSVADQDTRLTAKR